MIFFFTKNPNLRFFFFFFVFAGGGGDGGGGLKSVNVSLLGIQI